MFEEITNMNDLDDPLSIEHQSKKRKVRDKERLAMDGGTLFGLILSGHPSVAKPQPMAEDFKYEQDAKHYREQMEREKTARDELALLRSAGEADPASDSEEEERRKIARKKAKRKYETLKKKIRRKTRTNPQDVKDEAIPLTKIPDGMSEVLDTTLKDAIAAETQDIIPTKIQEDAIEGPVDDEDDEEEEDFALNDDDSKNPLTLQKYYYTEFKEGEQIEDNQDKGIDYLEMFSNNLHTVSYTRDEMCMIIDRLIEMSPSRIPKSRIELREMVLRDQDMCVREEEDKFLRVKKYTHERDCVNGEQCEGKKWCGDILVEKLSEAEQERFLRDGVLPQPPRMCVRCKRYRVMFNWINFRAEQANMPSNALLSDYYNVVNKRGEYPLEMCMLSGRRHFQGLPLPVVCEIGPYYERVVDNDDGVIYHKQSGYPYPEDREAQNEKLFFP